MTSIPENLANIRAQIKESATAAGRDPASVALLAVSKTRPVSDLRAALQSGQKDFGENYLQEALAKIHELVDQDIRWHFIGPIQSNKTRDLAAHFDWVHSVDRLKLAQRLSRQRSTEQPPLNICLQVNISGEASKAGTLPQEIPALAEAVAALPNLKLRGLMAIPAPETDAARQREPFARLRLLLESLKTKHPELDTLSMGMSGDLEAAIAEGATLVRVGTAIFGARA